jgi:PKD repeat protein
MKRRGLPLLATVALLALGCDSTNPVAPAEPAPGPGGGGGGTTAPFVLRLSADPPELTVDATEPSVVTLTATGSNGGPAPADGTKVAVNTSLGNFGLDGGGSPITLVTLTLAGGKATTQLYAGASAGVARLLAQLETVTAQLNVAITSPETTPFFLTSIVPTAGSAAGGTAVTIVGSGFVAPLRVAFGGVVGTVDETTLLPTQVTVVTPASSQPVPAGSTRVVDVAVTNALGAATQASDTLPGAFTYLSQAAGGPPVVLSVLPSGGPNAGGTEVTIQGDAFAAPVEVRFGAAGSGAASGVLATVLSATRTQILVQSPAADSAVPSLVNQSADVRVTNGDGTGSAVASSAFRFGGTMTVADVQPRSGTAAGGTTVTISGQFPVGANLQAEFGGQVQDLFGANTAGTQLTARSRSATVANCAPPSGPVTVRNLSTGETAASSIVWSYTAPVPALGSLAPGSGGSAGGTAVTLQGSGFDTSPLPRVTIGGVAATVTGSTGTAVTAATPAYTGTFASETCALPNGSPGSRFRPQAVDVVLTNLSTGCAATLANGFSYQPSDTSCRPDPNLPVAEFSFSRDGSLVSFKDASTGNPSSWSWDFGDGCASTEQNPVHCFRLAGSYTVRLTAANANGSSTKTRTVSIGSPTCPGSPCSF